MGRDVALGLRFERQRTPEEQQEPAPPKPSMEKSPPRCRSGSLRHFHDLEIYCDLKTFGENANGTSARQVQSCPAEGPELRREQMLREETKIQKTVLECTPKSSGLRGMPFGSQRETSP